MTLEGHSNKSTIWRITPESSSYLLVIFTTDKNALKQVNSFIFEKGRISISVPMQDTFPFKAMKETHEQQKTKIDIDKLIAGPTNITLS
jgi:hypothetical protein